MHSSYDAYLVTVSFLIASLASYVALDLAGRTNATRGRAQLAWLACGSIAMGVGIWSMHFIGMLAFHLHHDAGPEVQVGYDRVLLALSVVVAIAASALALTVASRPRLTVRGFAVAGALLGSAIAGMHYIGMAAMRMPAVLSYSTLLVVASLAIAGTASVVALVLARRLGETNTVGERWAKRAAAPVMGVAIAGMHYTAMAAARFAAIAGEAWVPDDSVVATDGLALAIALATLLVLGVALIGASLDRAHRSRLARTVIENDLRFHSLVEQSPEAIVLHAGGELLYVNPAAGNLLGFEDPVTLVGTSILDHIHADSREQAAERLKALAAGGHRSETIEYRLLHTDGRVLDVEVTSVRGSFDGRPAVQTHLRDVTERKALEQQLVHQAFHDALTGLANRALFRDRVKQALLRGTRRQNRPAVLFLDLDNFKAVNDGLGHASGDALLAAVGARLLAALRGSDTCARVGGDEFAVLIEEPGASGEIAADAAHVAERILETLQVPVTIEGAEVVVGVSIGIAIARDGDSGDDLLRNADLAMYRAKGHGRGRYEVFEPAMHDAVRRRLELETELRRAVEWCARDEDPSEDSPFVLHYQPITTLDTGFASGFEALVRWRHPERGLVAPLDFIPIAEETGLILPLGRWILATACRQVARWQAEHAAHGGDRFTLTVNVSAVQLMRPELTTDVSAALSASGLAPECLVLELTESMLVEDSNATLERLRSLKKLGLRLAIDDFGTGFSSLSYLERFPVDVLKIDKTFVDKIGAGGEGRDESALARAILGLGGALNMHVVAEGIETKAQWTRLVELGCELGQGYYFARPLPPEEVSHASRHSREEPSAL